MARLACGASRTTGPASTAAELPAWARPIGPVRGRRLFRLKTFAGHFDSGSAPVITFRALECHETRGGKMKFRATSICTIGLFVLALTALVVYRVTSAGSAYAAFPGSNGRITFARFNPAIGDFTLFTANPDGSHESQLTTFPAFVSDWSPDGSKIAFDFPSDATSGNIATINPDGSGFVQLTHEHNEAIVEP